MEDKKTNNFIRPAGAFSQTLEGWQEYQKQFIQEGEKIDNEWIVGNDFQEDGDD